MKNKKLTDINTLVNSDNIEDKLKVVQDPSCPDEVITSILNHENIDWTNKNNASLTNSIFSIIVSHSNTNLYSLMSIFSYYGYIYCNELNNLCRIKSGEEKGKNGRFALGDEKIINIRKLIIKHPKWDVDNIVSILVENIQTAEDDDHKCFMVGSITDADILDEECEKKIYDKLSKKVDSVYCLCEWVRIVMQMGDRKLAETLLHQAIEIADNQDRWNFIFDAEFESLRDSTYLKKVLEEKLEPAGFGRYADPDTGEVIAKMQDGKLVPV
jgi:hypothetical protein